ncbi:MAG: hypothetical protein IT384_01985 [Deltaproteobacteria bacterium]|nr:hypothetical protein [Deltaproteobacteria bacterium]
MRRAFAACLALLAACGPETVFVPLSESTRSVVTVAVRQAGVVAAKSFGAAEDARVIHETPGDVDALLVFQYASSLEALNLPPGDLLGAADLGCRHALPLPFLSAFQADRESSTLSELALDVLPVPIERLEVASQSCCKGRLEVRPLTNDTDANHAKVVIPIGGTEAWIGREDGSVQLWSGSQLSTLAETATVITAGARVGDRIWLGSGAGRVWAADRRDPRIVLEGPLDLFESCAVARIVSGGDADAAAISACGSVARYGQGIWTRVTGPTPGTRNDDAPLLWIGPDETVDLHDEAAIRRIRGSTVSFDHVDTGPTHFTVALEDAGGELWLTGYQTDRDPAVQQIFQYLTQEQLWRPITALPGVSNGDFINIGLSHLTDGGWIYLTNWGTLGRLTPSGAECGNPFPVLAARASPVFVELDPEHWLVAGRVRRGALVALTLE